VHKKVLKLLKLFKQLKRAGAYTGTVQGVVKYFLDIPGWEGGGLSTNKVLNPPPLPEKYSFYLFRREGAQSSPCMYIVHVFIHSGQ